MYVSTKSQSPFFKVEFKNPVSIGRIEWVRRIDGLDNNVGTLSQTTSADFTINYIGDDSVTKIFTLSRIVAYVNKLFEQVQKVMLP